MFAQLRGHSISILSLSYVHCSLFFSEAIQQAEMRERDNQITELTEKLANETEGRRMAEEQRNDLEQRLVRVKLSVVLKLVNVLHYRKIPKMS